MCPKQSFTALMLFLFFFIRLAQKSSLSAYNFYTDSENFVVNGFDVASYFSKSEPDNGKQSISTDFLGQLLYFHHIKTRLNT